MYFEFNHTNSFKFNKLITFDCESYRYKQGNKEIQKLAIIDFYDGINHYQTTNINDVEQLINELKLKYQKITFVAHNISYDLVISGIFSTIIKNKGYANCDLKVIMLDKIVFLKLSSKNYKYQINFLDSFNYFKVSLDKIAKSIGMEKSIKKVNYILKYNEWNEWLKDNLQSVRSDTEILYTYFKRFITNDNIDKGISISSTAFKTFKNRFNHIDFIGYSDKIQDASILSYRGGRTEAYILAQNKFLYVYDINSLYPFIMKNSKSSVKFKQNITAIDERILQNIKNKTYNYLFNVDFEIVDKSLLRVPVMVKHNSKLCSVYNYNDVWITGNELLELNNIGSLIVLHKGYEFYNDYIFTDYVDYFYELKRTSNDADKTFYKYMLNSLYGKFGMHKSINKILFDEDIPVFLKNILNSVKHKNRIKFDNKYYGLHDNYITYSEELKTEYPVLIASEITANARLYNYNLQKLIGFEHVYYTDTDSFFTDIELNPVLISDELGKLKLEKQSHFDIYGNKDYLDIDNKKRTIKGIKNNAEWKNNHVIIQSQFSNLKNSYSNQIVVTQIKKILNYKNDKLEYKFDISDGFLHGYPLKIKKYK